MPQVLQIDFEQSIADPRFKAMLELHAAELDALGLGVKIDYAPYVAIARSGRMVAVGAFEGTEPIGYWGFETFKNALNSELTASELAFYVRPDYRSKGIAKLMFEVAAGLLRLRDVRDVSIVTRDCVPAGRVLAQHLGFSKYGECYEMKL